MKQDIEYPAKYQRGFFIPDPRWMWENLGATELAGHRVLVHRAAVESLEAIDTHLFFANLAAKIYTVLSWAPRHKMRDPKRGYSMHAYGLALDINPDTNGYGTEGDLDPKIVKIFENAGWDWGGRWHTKDPMHFQKNLFGVR